MAKPASKRMALLEAYEELTRKEGVCLREQNHDALLETQRRKSVIVQGLEKLGNQSFANGEKEDFARRLRALELLEAEHAALLEAQLKANREQYRELGQRSNAAAHLMKAYGRLPGKTGFGDASLSDRA